jgi:hypothetical protein
LLRDREDRAVELAYVSVDLPLDRFTFRPILHLAGNVGRKLYHLERLTAEIQDRIVCGLDPYLPAAFSKAPILRHLVLTMV